VSCGANLANRAVASDEDRRLLAVVLEAGHIGYAIRLPANSILQRERVAAAGLRWPLPTPLTDRVLEAMLYAGHGRQQGARRKAEPDWAYVHHEPAGPASR
jgi:hypothetical protein